MWSCIIYHGFTVIFFLLLLERNNLRICKTFEKQTLKNKAGCLGEQSGVQSWSNCKLYTLEVDTHFRTNLASLLSQTFINQHAWDCGKFKEKCNSCFICFLLSEGVICWVFVSDACCCCRWQKLITEKRQRAHSVGGDRRMWDLSCVLGAWPVYSAQLARIDAFWQQQSMDSAEDQKKKKLRRINVWGPTGKFLGSINCWDFKTLLCLFTRDTCLLPDTILRKNIFLWSCCTPRCLLWCL